LLQSITDLKDKDIIIPITNNTINNPIIEITVQDRPNNTNNTKIDNTYTIISNKSIFQLTIDD